MDYTTLGRTGLRASVMGLGCGGHSRLGMSHGGTKEEAAGIVRAAIDLGVNFIDTAETYGTEEAVGLALAGEVRDEIILSTKIPPGSGDERLSAQDLGLRVEGCLRRLGVDRIDILHMHGVPQLSYPHVHEELVPELLKLREAGKIRFLGITEAFASDPQHRMLSAAVHDDCWDVVMTGFNILNQSARERVLTQTRAANIGVLAMFAVRRALTTPEALHEVIKSLSEQGQIHIDEALLDDPLGFLFSEPGATSLSDAAYRFCRDEPGIDIVLSGTGNIGHLMQNAASLMSPPLPAHHSERLRAMFAGIDSVSGN